MARSPQKAKLWNRQHKVSMLNISIEQNIHSARILIVDDEPANVRLLERVLQSAGYLNVVSTEDSRQVETLVEQQRPALLLLDLTMPHLDGFAVMASVKARLGPDEVLPILVLTADANAETRHRALKEGALDYLVKPLDALEVLLRVRNLLTLEHLLERERERSAALQIAHDERLIQLEQSNRLLEQANAELASANAHLQWAHREIEQAQDEIVNRLVEAVEVRGQSKEQTPTKNLNRVGQLAEDLAREMGLDARQIQLIRHAAPLHDVGKIGISDAVLLKPAELTPDEWDEVRSHVEIGAAMMSRSEVALMQMAQTIAYTHHERWDGLGYPNGLKGEETPIEGRILAVVDVFDALTTQRPYKDAWTVEQALLEIENQAERQFDPSVVRAFSRLMQRASAE